jgi:DNA-binding NarL/FixJ family response regulator
LEKRHYRPIEPLAYSFPADVWPHASNKKEFTMPSYPGAAMPAGGLYGSRIPSPRQQQVIELVAQGLKNSEVAEVIGTTEYVVKNHLRIIFDKLGLWNRVELALWYEARRNENLTDSRRNQAMA